VSNFFKSAASPCSGKPGAMDTNNGNSSKENGSSSGSNSNSNGSKKSEGSVLGNKLDEVTNMDAEDGEILDEDSSQDVSMEEVPSRSSQRMFAGKNNPENDDSYIIGDKGLSSVDFEGVEIVETYADVGDDGAEISCSMDQELFDGDRRGRMRGEEKNKENKDYEPEEFSDVMEPDAMIEIPQRRLSHDREGNCYWYVKNMNRFFSISSF